MSGIHQKPEQLSIFNFRKTCASHKVVEINTSVKNKAARSAYIESLEAALGLEKISVNQSKMIQVCIENSYLFEKEQTRRFLRNVAIRDFDGELLSERQSAYLISLYKRACN